MILNVLMSLLFALIPPPVVSVGTVNPTGSPLTFKVSFAAGALQACPVYTEQKVREENKPQWEDGKQQLWACGFFQDSFDSRGGAQGSKQTSFEFGWEGLPVSGEQWTVKVVVVYPDYNPQTDVTLGVDTESNVLTVTH